MTAARVAELDQTWRDGVCSYDDDVVVTRPVAPLVGRAGELAQLLTLLDRAEQSSASVAILGGDAGVGKTRLLSELSTAATERDAFVLVGHCVDLGDAPPPYLPFSEAFARLASDQAGLADTIVREFPAIARLLPARAPRPEGGDRLDRGELFEAVLGALSLLTATAPVLLVVEDAHWADQATRDLLGFLFTRIGPERLGIVVSYRSDDLHRRHPLRPTLAQWARLPVVTRISLEPLPAEDVRALVRSVQTGPLAEPDVSDIVNRAEGNAFFAEELLAAAEQMDSHQLPWHLADLLLVRLDRLSDDAREVVRAACVAGRSVPHGMLADVLGMPPARLDTALREAIDAHVLHLTRSGGGYAFRHALLAEAVYDDLLPGERVRLHGAYAEVLAQHPERSRAELARHALASQDLETAYSASVQAGDEAMGVAAPQEALQHYETALGLRAQLPDVAADSAIELVVAIVDAALAGGHAARGRRLASQALAELPADASDGDRAQLLYAVARAAVDSEGEGESMDTAAEALRLIPPDASVFRVRLAALFSRINLIRGRDVDAERWAGEAIAQADEISRPAAAAEARTTLAMLQRRASDPDEVAAFLGEVAEQARADGEAAAEIRSRYNLGSLYLEVGRLAESENAYVRAWHRAEAVGRSWSLFGADARARVIELRYMRGEWDDALRVASTTGESAPGVAAARITGAALMVRSGRGDKGLLAAADALQQWWSPESLVANSCLLAKLDYLAQTGEVDVFGEVLDQAVELLGTAWQDEWFLGRVRMSALGLAAAGRAARDRPAADRAALVTRAEQWLSDGRTSAEKGVPIGRRPGIEAEAWSARLEAQWAHLRWIADIDPPAEDEHIAAWRAAVDGFAYGNEPELARSRAYLAAVLRAAGRTTEAGEVAELARTVARRMGATPLLDDIRALGGGGGAPRPVAAATGIASLTEREREVLELLVDARTNRQIATRLYISEKTVSVHVSNILAKLGVRSRAEAAAVARANAPDS
jgi:DNA-binding NarL/FixJ family response regulator